MESLKLKEKSGLTREDLVAILGGSNVTNSVEASDSRERTRVQQTKQQQETCACDAIGYIENIPNQIELRRIIA